MLVKPASYRAARDLTFRGNTFAKGAPISNVIIKTLPHLSSLLSRRFIEPVPDPNRRRGPWRHWPTHVGTYFFAGSPSVLREGVSSDVSSESPTGSEDPLAGYPEHGTIPDVKAWVGDDQARAEYAIEQEEAKSSPRVTLLDHLYSIGA